MTRRQSTPILDEGLFCHGRRGFLLVLDQSQEPVTVRPGDKVFVAGQNGIGD